MKLHCAVAIIVILVNSKKWVWSFLYQGVVFMQNKCFYPLLDSTHDKIKLLKNFTVWLHEPHLPAAVTGFPTGVEFKPFNICY